MCNCNRSLLLIDPSGQTAILRAQVGVLGALCRPSRLDQGRPQVSIAITCTPRFAPATGSVVARTQPTPTCQMFIRGEVSLDLDANFRNNDLGHALPNPRYGLEQRSAMRELGAAHKHLINSVIDSRLGRLQFLDSPQQPLEDEALCRSQSPIERTPQLGLLAFELPAGHPGQYRSVGFTTNQGRDHRSSAFAKRVTGDLRQLDVARFQDFDDPVVDAGPLSHQAFTIPSQFEQLANHRRRNEARTNQVMRQQIGQPLRVTDIGLVTRDRFDVQRVDQNYFERAFQDVEDWLPVDPSALNPDVSAVRLDQPDTQPQQIIGHRAESSSLPLTVIAQARDQHLRVHINSTTDRINDLHRILLSVRRESLQVKENLLCLLAHVRGQMRWYLGEALRSDFVTDSRYQGHTIFASALTTRILTPFIPFHSRLRMLSS